MEDVNISKYRASVVREGSKPASPGFVVSEGQSPTDPAGSGQNHLPVTIAPVSTALAITENQILSGAGTVAQYIRGDGSLADFPESSGGGSSVSYYLNGSVNQGTIGGVAYKELNKVPILGAGTDFSINADGYIASFITDVGDPNLLEIPGGNWNFETYFSASSSGGTPTFYVELYKVSGTTATLIASSVTSPEFIAFGTNLTPYFSTLAVPTTTLALTDRLAVRYYVTHSGRTITMHTENNHLCQIITTFTTGLTALNGLTAQVQNFAVGTSGTDFNIASATATHTFNLPTASATNRGALSSGDWTTFNNKQNALGYVPVPETRTITINGTTQDLSANRTFNVGTVTSVGLSSATIGVSILSGPITSSGNLTFDIATASGSQNGLLSSTDWTTFNNKQNALTNPVTGTGTTNRLAKFTGASTIGNSNISDGGITILNENPIAGQFAWQFNGNTTTGLSFGASVVAGTNSSDIAFRVLNAAASSNYFVVRGDGNVGIGTSSPAVKLDVLGEIRSTSTSGYAALLSISALGYSILADTHIGGAMTIWTAGSEKMRIFSDGNVGINTGDTNNGAKLQVIGTAYFSSNVRINGNDLDLNNGSVLHRITNDNTNLLIRADYGNDSPNSTIQFSIDGNTQMLLNSSGNLGLGVTPSAWNSSFRAIQVGVGASFWASNISTLPYAYMSSNQLYDASNTSRYIINGSASWYIQEEGTHKWLTAPSGTAGNAISFTQAMTLTSGGNLLVGTVSDNGARLQTVGGAVSFNNGSAQSSIIGTTFTGFEYTRGSTIFGFIGTENSASGGMRYNSVAGNFEHKFYNNSNLALTIASTGAATFSSSVTAASGNILSGTPQLDFTLNVNTAFKHSIVASNFASSPVSSNTLDFRVANGANSQVVAMTLNGSGNVGIGITNPIYKFEISDGTRTGVFNPNSVLDGFFIGTYQSKPLIFGTADTERMRITSGGNVLIGTTTDNGARLNIVGGALLVNETSLGDGVIQIRFNDSASSPLNNGITIAAARTNSSRCIGFANPNGLVGSIVTSGSSTSYNINSDYRLKTDLKDYNGLNLISKIKTYDFEWKTDKSRAFGVIAHELQEVISYAVTGKKDSQQMQGVDYSKLVPIMVKAIQELKQEIDTLKN